MLVCKRLVWKTLIYQKCNKHWFEEEEARLPVLVQPIEYLFIQFFVYLLVRKFMLVLVRNYRYCSISRYLKLTRSLWGMSLYYRPCFLT